MRAAPWLFVALAGCRAAALPTRSPAARAVVRSREVSAWAYEFDLSRARGCVSVRPAAPGVERLLVGGRPAERRGEGWAFGPRAFAAELGGALEADDGWHFFSEHARWRADSFTGEPVALAEDPDARVGRGVGRVVLVRNGVAEGLPFDLPVIDAAFEDDRRGVAIVEPGTVVATEDGARWSPVPLPDDAPLRVAASRDERWVLGATSSWTLQPDAAPARVANDARPHFEGCDSGPEAGPEYPLLVEALGWSDEARTGVLLAQGRRWLGALDLRTGAFEPTRGPAPEDGERCTLAEGSSEVAVCGTDGPPYQGPPERLRVWARGAGGAWSHVMTARICNERRCAATPDGRRIVCGGACDPGGACGAGTTLCERGEDGVVRQRSAGSRHQRFAAHGWVGGELLLVSYHRRLDESEFVLGDAPARPLCPPGSAGGIVDDNPMHGSHLGRDGVVRRVVTTPDGRRALLEIRPGESCSLRAGPPPSPGQDPPRPQWCGPDGIAMAPGAGVPWISTAPGEPWTPAVRDPALLDDLRRRNGWGFSCDATGWRVGIDRGLRVFGWAEPRSLPREWIGEDVERPFAPPPDVPDPPLAAWRCSTWAAPPEQPDPPAASEAASEGVFTVPRGDRWFVRSSLDPARRGPVRWLSFRVGDGPAAAFLPLRLDAEALLAMRTRDLGMRGTYVGAFELVRLTRDGAPRVLATAALNGWLADWDVLRDGPRTVIWIEASAPTYWLCSHAVGPLAPAARGLLLRVEGERVTVAHAAVEPAAEGRLGPFSRGDAWGLARLRADGAVFGALPGSLPALVAPRVASEPCGPRATGAMALAQWASVGGEAQPVEASYAFEAGRTCLRGLDGLNLHVTAAGRELRGAGGARCGREGALPTTAPAPRAR